MEKCIEVSAMLELMNQKNNFYSSTVNGYAWNKAPFLMVKKDNAGVMMRNDHDGKDLYVYMTLKHFKFETHLIGMVFEVLQKYVLDQVLP